MIALMPSSSSLQVVFGVDKTAHIVSSFSVKQISAYGGDCPNDNTCGFKITGTNANDLLGTSVQGGGDFNSDSIDDFVVGAPGAQTAYVIFGKSASQWTADSIEAGALPTTQAIQILSGTAGFLLGQAVSPAGDVNHDGLMDILVGAPDGGQDTREQMGYTYVIFGVASAGTGCPDENNSPPPGTCGDDSCHQACLIHHEGNPNQQKNCMKATCGNGGQCNLSPTSCTACSTETPPQEPEPAPQPEPSAPPSCSGHGRCRSLLSFGPDVLSQHVVDDMLEEEFEVEAVGMRSRLSHSSKSHVHPTSARGLRAQPTAEAACDVRVGGVVTVPGDLDGTVGFTLSGYDRAGRLGFSVNRAGDVNGDGVDDLVVGAYNAASGSVATGGTISCLSVPLHVLHCVWFLLCCF